MSVRKLMVSVLAVFATGAMLLAGAIAPAQAARKTPMPKPATLKLTGKWKKVSPGSCRSLGFTKCSKSAWVKKNYTMDMLTVASRMSSSSAGKKAFTSGVKSFKAQHMGTVKTSKSGPNRLAKVSVKIDGVRIRAVVAQRGARITMITVGSAKTLPSWAKMTAAAKKVVNPRSGSLPRGKVVNTLMLGSPESGAIGWAVKPLT